MSIVGFALGWLTFATTRRAKSQKGCEVEKRGVWRCEDGVLTTRCGDDDAVVGYVVVVRERRR